MPAARQFACLGPALWRFGSAVASRIVRGLCRRKFSMPQKSFADLGVSRAVAAALRDRGVHTPFPIQELVIADVLAGRDVLAKSPTGSGKTLAFGVPLVDRLAADARRPAALILAPTRELAGQIVDELRPLARVRNLSVAAVY